MIQVNLLPKQKDIHRLRKWTYGCHRKEIVKDFGNVMYTPLYLKWIANKDLLYSTWNSAQCSVPSWMEVGFGGELVHMAEMLCPETVRDSLVAQTVKNLPAMQETRVWSLGQEDPVATHSCIFAWRVPWTEEAGRLRSTESQSRTRLIDTHVPLLWNDYNNVYWL